MQDKSNKEIKVTEDKGAQILKSLPKDLNVPSHVPYKIRNFSLRSWSW